MVHEVMHIGITVSDIQRSIAFYRDLLGLAFHGELLMEGEATDRLFSRNGTRVKVAYLNGSKEIGAPPIELLQFIGPAVPNIPADLFRISISEICFRVRDIDSLYRHLAEHGVKCLSSPQFFDFTSTGHGKSKAFYFKDPDRIILEAMEPIA